MILTPVSLEPPRSSILSVADTIDGDWVSHGVVLGDQPTGHVNIAATTAVAAPGTANKQTAICGGTRFFPFPMDWRTELTGLSGGAAETLASEATLASHALEADTAWAISSRLQLGCTVGAQVTPGFATLPVGIGAGQVPFLTLAGREATNTGGAMSLEQGISVLLSWWRVYGLPGMGLVHLPSELAPFAAMKRLVDVGQQGAAYLAGGMARLSLGPGYDSTIGPGGAVAGAGEAWIWISSRVYADVTEVTVDRAVQGNLNQSMSKAQRFGIYAFNTNSVAAAKVLIA